MDKKIVKNIIYNATYQLLIVIIPFITIPYISRVFTSEDLGVYSKTFANVNLFSILGMFAINAYGTRIIAKNRENKYLLSEKYYELRNMQLITTTIAFSIYILVFIVFNKSYRTIYLFQSINIIAFMFDISWLYMGLEEFKKIVTRNIFVKIISVIMIFLLVENVEDLKKYILIISISSLVGNLVMWKYKDKYVVYIHKKNRKINLISNLKQAFFLFIPIFCYQIYTSFDRSILSNVSSLNEVGMFDQSQKIIRISVAIVTSIGTVMLPRITNMLNDNNKKDEIDNILKSSINLTVFISCGATFGLLAISKNFVPWFYGEEYLGVLTLINITSIVCIITSLGSFFSNQYAIPNDNKKAYIIPIIGGAVFSIILNLILGSYLGAIGAAITIVFVEMISLLLRIIYLKKELDIKFLFGDFYKFIIAGLSMYIVVIYFSNLLDLEPNIYTTAIECILGIIIYIFCIIILNKNIYKKIKTNFIK